MNVSPPGNLLEFSGMLTRVRDDRVSNFGKFTNDPAIAHVDPITPGSNGKITGQFVKEDQQTARAKLCFPFSQNGRQPNRTSVSMIGASRIMQKEIGRSYAT